MGNEVTSFEENQSEIGTVLQYVELLVRLLGNGSLSFESFWNSSDNRKLVTYSLVMVEGIDVLKWSRGEFGGKRALHPDWNRRPLFQGRIRLRAFIFVFVIVPNLLRNSEKVIQLCALNNCRTGPPLAFSLLVLLSILYFYKSSIPNMW